MKLIQNKVHTYSAEMANMNIITNCIISRYDDTVLWTTPNFSISQSNTRSFEPLGRNLHVAKSQTTHGTTQTQNKSTQKSLPRLGLELTIEVFEWAKKVTALHHAVTVTG
jgi:hypothetical protein